MLNNSKCCSNDGNNRNKLIKNLINEYESCESFIYEECHICHKHLTRTEDILVDVNSDNYICEQCKNKYDIQVVECSEL